MANSNNRRYYLHSKLRKEGTNARVKSQMRTVYVTNEDDITDIVNELRTKFGYAIQYEIPN